jgi:D-amino-acid dehydrogenase
MNSEKVDVLVLGAGIVGLSTALELQRSGRQVTIIDRGEPGYGCSYGNAGWITPCFSMPLPQPGMFWKSIGWLLNPDSPLRIKPQPSWLLVRWMTHFLLAMNERRMRESVAVLTDISKFSLQSYAELAARAPKSFGFDQKGLLLVSGTDDGFKAAKIEMDLMSERGVPGKLMTGEEIVAMEPSLKNVLKGGVYFPSEAHSEPLLTVQALVTEFESLGGKIQTKTEVFDFTTSNANGASRIDEVHTTRGKIRADLVVLAMGTWSEDLAKRLGIRVPILGGKGYRIITNSFDVTPAHPIMIVDRKIAVTPRYDGYTSVAGTLELVNQDFEITPRRLNNIITGTKQYMNMSAGEPEVKEIWRGLRPCTPDGVPMIGFSKKQTNLFYSIGHQMLGLQSAPGSGRLAADLILGRPAFTDARPFRPERYE